MKILHVDTETTWYGGQRQAFYLASGLAQQGHTSVVASPSKSPLAQECKKSNVEVVEIPLRGELDLLSAVQLRTLIKKRGFEIVHAHTAHAHTLVGLATLGNPNIGKVVSRRVDYSIFRSGSILSRWKYLRLGIDRYIAISQAVSDILEHDGVHAEKISIVHDGVAFPPHSPEKTNHFDVRSHYKIGASSPLIGTIAQLSDYKGYQFLADAIPLILKEIPQATFLWIGEGILKERLKNQIRKLGVEKAVIFAGYQQNLEPFWKAFDFMVVPSHMEGLNSSLLDGLARGKPIVASAAGGIPEVIQDGENGVLVPIRSPQALAEGVIRLLKDPGLIQKAAQAGPKTIAQRFTLNHMVTKTEQIYLEILKTKIH
jgi:glycosyltransferase involved in cell wall biosynthesis